MLLLLPVLYAWLLLVLHAGSGLLAMPGPWLKPVRIVLSLLPLALILGLLGQAQGAALWWRLPTWSQGTALSWGALLLWVVLVPGRGVLHLVRMQRDLGLLKGQLRALDHLRVHPELALRSACETLAVSSPRLYGMKGVESPFVLGTLAPAIVLPIGWLPRDWRGSDPYWDGIGEEAVKAPSELRAALWHELAHVKRRDVQWRLLRILGTLVLPWEWVASGNSTSRFWAPRWARLEAAHQEAEAEALASGMDGTPPSGKMPVRGAKKAVFLSFLFLGLLLGGFSLLPGRGALAVALGLEVPRYGLLPSGWRLSPALPRAMGKSMVQPRIHLRAGMLPQRLGEGPRLSIEMPKDLPQGYMNANLSTFVSVHDEDLPTGSQIEFRWEIDAPASVTFTGREVRPGLLAFAGTRIHTFVPTTTVAQVPSATVKPGMRRWSFAARQGVPDGYGTARVFSVGFGPLRKGRYLLKPPTLCRVEPGGQRVPFRTLE